MNVKEEFCVFELEPGTKKPKEIGYQAKSRTMEVWPKHVGVNCKKSNLVVIDLDHGEAGKQDWSELCKELGISDETLYHSTPHGVHAFFRYNEGDIGNSRLTAHLEVKGFTCVVPPTPGYGEFVGEIVDLPDELRDCILNHRKEKFVVPTGDIDRLRHVTLCSIAGGLWNVLPNGDMVYAALSAVNRSQCKPPLPDKDIHDLAYKSTRTWGSTGRDTHSTDMGNADRFLEAFGKDVRFCPLWKGWMVWDGHRWERDEEERSTLMAKRTVTEFYKVAKLANNSDKVKQALSSESAYKIAAMLRLARCEVPVRPGAFDSDGMQFNVLNGTVNLRTGELHPHSREDFNTRLGNVTYDEAATCPRWLEFLDYIFGSNQSLTDFIQRTIGYSLTGNIGEQCIFVFHGKEGDNGKTTLCETVGRLFGDYKQVAAATSFVTKKYGRGIPTDIARMKGARMVLVSELEANQQLAEARIKDMTGGEMLTGRFLYGKDFDYRPQFKLFVRTNHKPRIIGTDHAIWRRIRLVPFEVVIPPEKKIRDYDLVLSEELPGILNWAIDGCLKWQEMGLKTPDTVVTATNQYRTEEDVHGLFLAECCEYTGTVSAKTLYNAYKVWCEDQRHTQIMSGNLFGRVMTEKNYERSRRTYKGISLTKGFEDVLLTK